MIQVPVWHKRILGECIFNYNVRLSTADTVLLNRFGGLSLGLESELKGVLSIPVFGRSILGHSPLSGEVLFKLLGIVFHLSPTEGRRFF